MKYRTYEEFVDPANGKEKFKLYVFDICSNIISKQTLYADDLDHAKYKSNYMHLDEIPDYNWHVVTTYKDNMNYEALADYKRT